MSPDEQGRVETLKVREGDRAKSATSCSRSMTICKSRSLCVENTAVVNAQQSFDRARHC